MTTTRAVVAVLLAACGLAIAPFAGAALADDPDTTTEEPGDGPSMGSEVSAFMQASGVNAENAVESKTFDADYRNADENARADVVSDRVDRLEDRLADLEDEREELRERKDELPDVAYDARMTRLAAQINALEVAIDEVESRSVDVDEQRLADLRAGAGNVSGPEVAAIASETAVADPPGGPPEETPDQGEPQAPENETETRETDESSPDEGT